MRKAGLLAALTSLLLLGGCSDLKLSNNRTWEQNAGQSGADVTHEVTERHVETQAGAIGVAVSEKNPGTQGSGTKTNAEAGATTGVENTGTQEVPGVKPDSSAGKKQKKH
jgi:hypothetical protein